MANIMSKRLEMPSFLTLFNKAVVCAIVVVVVVEEIVVVILVLVVINDTPFCDGCSWYNSSWCGQCYCWRHRCSLLVMWWDILLVYWCCCYFLLCCYCCWFAVVVVVVVCIEMPPALVFCCELRWRIGRMRNFTGTSPILPTYVEEIFWLSIVLHLLMTRRLHRDITWRSMLWNIFAAFFVHQFWVIKSLCDGQEPWFSGDWWSRGW